MSTYDHWKSTNPQDEWLGLDPEEDEPKPDYEWAPEDELPADWPPADDDPKSY